MKNFTIQTNTPSDVLYTRERISRLFISILFLSLIWTPGKKGFEKTAPPKEGTPVVFTFILPSMREMLGPTGETDLFTSEPIQWVSFSNSPELFFQPTLEVAVTQITDPWENFARNSSEKTPFLLPRKWEVQPAPGFRRRASRFWKHPHPIPRKGEESTYRKKATSKVGWSYKRLPSTTHWEET